MFGTTTTTSSQSSNEPAKLNVEVHPPPSKPTRKGLDFLGFKFIRFLFLI